MKKSLVTGAAGFIGAHVVKHLLDAGHEVIALDDLSGGFIDNVDTRAEFINGSILDQPLIKSMFTDSKIDYVFHLAAYAAEGLSHFIRRFNYENNLLGSVNLINEAVNSGTVKCFVFTSSIAVYGCQDELPMKEQMHPNPEDPYGIAKYAVEMDLKQAKAMFDMDHIIFRPHNVYGELQNTGDPYRNVIGIFMNNILNHKPMTIFGDGSQTRAFTYIDDVAPIIANSVNRPDAYNRVFNLGSDKPETVLKLAVLVASVMQVEPDISFLPTRQEVVHAYSDHTLARECFGDLIDSIPLEDGLAKMARWIQRAGSRTSRIFDNIEVTKGLPEGWISSGVIKTHE